MEEKGLIFEKANGFNYCTIMIEADSYDIHNTIDALLTCLHEPTEDLLDKVDRYNICQLIRALLPSKEQMKLMLC